MDEEKTAKYYINKYGLKRQFDPLTNTTTYKRELHTRHTNIEYSLTARADNPALCTFMVLRFDRWKGDFAAPKFIENIKNDIMEKEIEQ